jgi:2'-5' RNA ligase
MRTFKLGVVSVLEGEAYAETKRMWRLFEEKYYSTAIQNFPHPHLSFQGGISKNLKTIDSELQNLSHEINPFPVTIRGIETFEKPERVIFLSVKRTKILRGIHKKIDALLQTHCSWTFPYYTPQNWIPHVTLIQRDITPSDFRNAIRELENYRPQYELTLRNICLVIWYDQDRKIRIHKKYLLR